MLALIVLVLCFSPTLCLLNALLRVNLLRE